MVAFIRPAELLARPEIKTFLRSIDVDGRLRDSAGIPPEEIEQLTLVWFRGKQGPGPMLEPSAVIARAANPQDWKPLTDKLPFKVEEARFQNFTYYRSTAPTNRQSYARVDDRTVILAEEADLLHVLAARPGEFERTVWAGVWKEVGKGQIAAAVDMAWLKNRLEALHGNRPPGDHSSLDGFEPLLSQAKAYAIGVDMLGKLRIDGVASCETDAGVAQVADTLKALLVLGRNTLNLIRERSLRDGGQITAAEKLGLDAAAALAKAEIKVDGRLVRVSAATELDAAGTIAALAPAVERNAPRRSGCRAPTT